MKQRAISHVKQTQEHARQTRRTFVEKCKACFHPKLVHASKRSRVWFEMLTAAGAVVESHLRMVAVVSVLWIIVDIYLLLKGEEL
jgi:hypothetical protein